MPTPEELFADLTGLTPPAPEASIAPTRLEAQQPAAAPTATVTTPNSEEVSSSQGASASASTQDHLLVSIEQQLATELQGQQASLAETHKQTKAAEAGRAVVQQANLTQIQQTQRSVVTQKATNEAKTELARLNVMDEVNTELSRAHAVTDRQQQIERSDKRISATQEGIAETQLAMDGLESDGVTEKGFFSRLGNTLFPEVLREKLRSQNQTLAHAVSARSEHQQSIAQHFSNNAVIASKRNQFEIKQELQLNDTVAAMNNAKLDVTQAATASKLLTDNYGLDKEGVAIASKFFTDNTTLVNTKKDLYSLVIAEQQVATASRAYEDREKFRLALVQQLEMNKELLPEGQPIDVISHMMVAGRTEELQGVLGDSYDVTMRAVGNGITLEKEYGQQDLATTLVKTRAAVAGGATDPKIREQSRQNQVILTSPAGTAGVQALIDAEVAKQGEGATLASLKPAQQIKIQEDAQEEYMRNFEAGGDTALSTQISDTQGIVQIGVADMKRFGLSDELAKKGQEYYPESILNGLVKGETATVEAIQQLGSNVGIAIAKGELTSDEGTALIAVLAATAKEAKETLLARDFPNALRGKKPSDVVWSVNIPASHKQPAFKANLLDPLSLQRVINNAAREATFLSLDPSIVAPTAIGGFPTIDTPLDLGLDQATLQGLSLQTNP